MRSNLKLATITLTLIVAMACWASAQTYGTPPQQQDESQMTGHQGMRAEGAQNRLDWLSQQLNLTDDQKAKLQPILQNEEQQMKAVHDNTSLTKDQKRDQLKQIHQSSQPQIQAILTPEQRQKFAQIKAERKQRHEENVGTSGENAPTY